MYFWHAMSRMRLGNSINSHDGERVRDSGQGARQGTTDSRQSYQMDSRQFWVCGHELTPGTDFGQHDSRALERLCVFLGICCLVEILILCLLLVLVAICIYSALFMRFVWMVQPRNYLLLACHLSNETVQLYQHSRCSKRQGFQGAGQGTVDSRQSYQQCVSTQCCSLDLHGWYSLAAIYFWHAIPRIRPCYSINSHDGIQAKWLGKEQRFQYNLIRAENDKITPANHTPMGFARRSRFRLTDVPQAQTTFIDSGQEAGHGTMDSRQSYQLQQENVERNHE
ncbi:uncharacterized protein LOC132165591 [Corylus avellana]|uniref:uncharacterized protein LOC132165591 n=1 Tax=Corylus avellana TaxID=13451 RepID=UPI00286B1BA4|nr:uncharacterized protein LOC132165591 [Corylus avellana]